MPTWILALSYWLHMVATIVWVGGLALLTLVIWPGARAALGSGPEVAALFAALHKRFAPLGWFSLAVLTATGLTQMVGHPQYGGFLQIDNQWAWAILLKHVAVGGMVGVGLYMQLGLQPALARQALLAQRGRPALEMAALQRREVWLLRLNLLCGLLVLGLTAAARVL